MYICLCHGITDRQIRDAVSGGCCSFREVRTSLKVGTQCGKCACTAKGLVRETLADPLFIPARQASPTPVMEAAG